ncbi:unnamed protein product, partial [Iphiclides podalirius]
MKLMCLNLEGRKRRVQTEDGKRASGRVQDGLMLLRGSGRWHVSGSMNRMIALVCDMLYVVTILSIEGTRNKKKKNTSIHI